MNTLEIKTMLEYVLDQMKSCKTAEECQNIMQSAIELCGAHNMEQLQQEFGLL